jgi:hypothetical protein
VTGLAELDSEGAGVALAEATLPAGNASMHERPPCVPGSVTCAPLLDPESAPPHTSESAVAGRPRAPSLSSACKVAPAPNSLDADDLESGATGAAEAQKGAGVCQRIPSASLEEIVADLPPRGLASVEAALHSIYLRSVLAPCDYLQRHLDAPSRAFDSSSAGSVLFSRFPSRTLHVPDC